MKLHYQELGSGETVVILHGLFGSGDNWLGPARDLGSSHHVIVPDMPNHGSSPHGTSMRYPVMAAEIAAFLEHVAPVHLVGHSMGGKVALALALDFPELVRTITIVDICPVRYQPSHESILEGMRAVADAAPDRRADADTLLAEYVAAKAVRAFLLKSYDARSARWKLNVPLIHADYDHILDWPYADDSSVDRPCLLIYGGRSQYATASGREAMKRLAPAVKMHCVQDAGHWVHAEQPRETVEAIRGFIAP